MSEGKLPENVKPAGKLAALSWRLKQLKQQVYIIYLAMQDERTPWHAKVLAAIVVGYTLSPIDLIPDFVPVFGYLDDIILIPLGVAIVIRLIPQEIIADCTAKALAEPPGRKPKNWVAAGIIILIWIAGIAYTIKLTADFLIKH